MPIPIMTTDPDGSLRFSAARILPCVWRSSSKMGTGPRCNGLQWKWVRTAINVFLGPH